MELFRNPLTTSTLDWLSPGTHGLKRKQLMMIWNPYSSLWHHLDCDILFIR
jgi:hypothetical protein